MEFCTLPPSPTVLVLINPRSGPGKAQQIFESTVKPMLDEADIVYKILITGENFMIQHLWCTMYAYHFDNEAIWKLI